MAILLGIDEAGYGPNLGPLVIGATAWQVPDVKTDLYELLSQAISREPHQQKLAVADSKALYKPSGGLQQLERGVLTTLAAIGRVPTDTPLDWQDFWNATGADQKNHRRELPWYADFHCPLPVDTDLESIRTLQQTFQQVCRSAKVKLLDLQARASFPTEFNRLTEHYGTKGAALSHISISLLKNILLSLVPSPSLLTPIHITCDKHGGRNRYGALLQHHFPDEWIETVTESRPFSQYRWGPKESRVTVTFRTKGETELATALASMLAKYHRELAMRAFNAYWTNQLPDIKPTAGYPQDAKRFKADIAEKQKQLAIDDDQLWRNR